MIASVSFGLLVAGIVKVSIWLVGAILAGYRKRGFLLVGFTLAALSTAVRALADLGVDVPVSLINTVAGLAVVTAFLIVGSFVWHQPRGERPDRWAP